MLLALLYAVSMAIAITWGTLIDEFLQESKEHESAHFTVDQVGAIGTTLNLAGMVGGIIVALLVDRFEVPMKQLMILLYLLQAATIGVFMVAVYFPAAFGGSALHVPYLPVFISCIAQGIAGAGLGPLAYELGAELAYPVGEETSATFLAVLGNLFYILAMQLIGDRVSA
eukprot:SAG31_NODE_10738_length_1104_cov_0.870647_1_plen_170_part_00